MSVQAAIERIRLEIRRHVAAVEPYRAVVTSVGSGLVGIKRIGASTADTRTYARVIGFSLAADDVVLVANLNGEPVVIGKIQTSASTGYTLDAQLTIGTATIRYGTGRPVGSVTGNRGDLYIQTDGVGRRIHWVKASGTGNTDWQPTAAPSSFHEQSWRQMLVAPGATTVSSPGFAAEPTLTATLTNGDDADGTMLIHTTGASSGNASGMVTARTVTQRRWNPVMVMRVKTQASVSSIRLWCGLSDSDLSGSATPTARYAAFRYSTGTDGTAFWRACTDGNTGTPNVTTTTVAVAVNTSYLFRIEIDNDNTEVRFYIDNVLVATHTSKIPSASTGLGIELDVTTLTNATRAIGWGRAALGNR